MNTLENKCPRCGIRHKPYSKAKRECERLMSKKSGRLNNNESATFDYMTKKDEHLKKVLSSLGMKYNGSVINDYYDKEELQQKSSTIFSEYSKDDKKERAKGFSALSMYVGSQESASEDLYRYINRYVKATERGDTIEADSHADEGNALIHNAIKEGLSDIDSLPTSMITFYHSDVPGAPKKYVGKFAQENGYKKLSDIDGELDLYDKMVDLDKLFDGNITKNIPTHLKNMIQHYEQVNSGDMRMLYRGTTAYIDPSSLDAINRYLSSETPSSKDEKVVIEELEKTFKTGDTFTLQGFSSTSASYKEAYSFIEENTASAYKGRYSMPVMFAICTDKGAYIDHQVMIDDEEYINPLQFTDFDESEILLSPSQRFTIGGIITEDPNKDNNVPIVLLVPEGTPVEKE